ncbi:COX15/CtaA family protein [Vibrio sp. 188UL20-2]|uniref:COX15/CtaA family protein n=2 Tax=Vibrio ulleungensis TaxID=2807619 RepID=A0ABS2HHU5_9VIBR|nr:COX15/CtaA family protein [Vibrio ulleungensis]
MAKGFLLLTRSAAVLTLIVIALGAYTRLADAGLGCPDWPGCYGQLIVPSSDADVSLAEAKFPERPVEADKAWLEMIHRYAASTLGLFILAIGFLGWKNREQVGVTSLSLVVLVLLQGALGAWTVTLKLMPVIVMLHLLGGFTIFSLLILLHNQLMKVRPAIKSAARNVLSTELAYPKLTRLRHWSAAALVVLVIQIMLGGWTSSNYAALMCTSLPICNGDWISYLDFKNAFTLVLGHDNYEYGVLEYPARMTIHVTHRIGAVITTLVFGFFILRLFQFATAHKQPNIAVWALLLLLLLLTQLGLGIINVVMSLPLLNAVAHNVVASLLLVTTVTTLFQVRALQRSLTLTPQRAADNSSTKNTAVQTPEQKEMSHG